MPKEQGRGIFDSDSNLVAWEEPGETPRDLKTGETAVMISADKIAPGATVGNGHYDDDGGIALGLKGPTYSTRQRSSWGLHHQYNVWYDQLVSYERVVPFSAVRRGKDWLVSARRSLWLLATGNAKDSNDMAITMTDTNFATWCTEMGQGAADITNALEFYQKAAGMSSPADNVAKAWVDLTTLQRVNLANSVTVFGTVPASVNLLTGAWIEDA